MKRFYINCIIRVLLLSGTICLPAYLLFKTDFIAATIFVSLVGAYQIFALIRYVSKTNRDLTRLLQSIKYSDFSQSFAANLKGSGFEELHTAFTEVIQEFQRTKIEKEEHFRFLQTIVDHEFLDRERHGLCAARYADNIAPAPGHRPGFHIYWWQFGVNARPRRRSEDLECGPFYD